MGKMIDKKGEEMIYQLPPKNFVIVPCDIDKKDHIHINIQGRFIVAEKKFEQVPTWNCLTFDSLMWINLSFVWVRHELRRARK